MAFRVVRSLTGSQVDDLMELYKHTYWASERSKEDVMRMLQGADHVYGVVDDETGRLRAFTRVLSDGVYRAVIFDVVVHPDFRGQGLARQTLEAVMSDGALKDVEMLLLYCRPEVLPLYAKMGFEDMHEEMHLMRRKRAAGN